MQEEKRNESTGSISNFEKLEEIRYNKLRQASKNADAHQVTYPNLNLDGTTISEILGL